MPWIFAALRIFIIANVVGFAVRIIAAMGFVFYVVDPVINILVGMLSGQFGGLPPVVSGWVGFLNIDRFVSLVLSAYTIVLATNFVLRVNR
jgi:hypothetical protein